MKHVLLPPPSLFIRELSMREPTEAEKPAFELLLDAEGDSSPIAFIIDATEPSSYIAPDVCLQLTRLTETFIAKPFHWTKMKVISFNWITSMALAELKSAIHDVRCEEARVRREAIANNQIKDSKNVKLMELWHAARCYETDAIISGTICLDLFLRTTDVSTNSSTVKLPMRVNILGSSPPMSTQEEPAGVLGMDFLDKFDLKVLYDPHTRQAGLVRRDDPSITLCTTKEVIKAKPIQNVSDLAPLESSASIWMALAERRFHQLPADRIMPYTHNDDEKALRKLFQEKYHEELEEKCKPEVVYNWAP